MEKDELAVLVGKNIAKQRKKIKLSQKELAQCLDITVNAIIRMEKGLIAPKMSRIQELANALNCSVITLFTNENQTISPYADTINSLFNSLSVDEQKNLAEIMLLVVKSMKG